MPEDTISPLINPSLLAEYEAQLDAIRFEGVGTVAALFVSPRPDEHTPVSSLRVVPEIGVEGQYPGKQWWQGRRVSGRQVSALNAEALDALEIAYDVPGDNLVIRGIDLELFGPGDTLRIGDALLFVTQTPHRPCAKLARRTSPAKKEALSAGRRRGLLLDARRPATISVSDLVERIVFSPETV